MWNYRNESHLPLGKLYSYLSAIGYTHLSYIILVIMGKSLFLKSRLFEAWINFYLLARQSPHQSVY